MPPSPASKICYFGCADMQDPVTSGWCLITYRDNWKLPSYWNRLDWCHANASHRYLQLACSGLGTAFKLPRKSGLGILCLVAPWPLVRDECTILSTCLLLQMLNIHNISLTVFRSFVLKQILTTTRSIGVNS